MWVSKFLGRPIERRRSRRIGVRGLVAYYWTGAIPAPRDVREIGLYGARIAAPERFYPGTLVQMLLEDTSAQGNDGPPHQAGVYAKAVRPAEDGFCVEFLFGDSAERKRFWRFLGELPVNAPKEPVPPPEGAKEPAAPAEGEGERADAGAGNGTSPGGQEEAEPIQEPDPNDGPGACEEPEDTEGTAKHMATDKQQTRGQALIEFALILPLLFLLIVNVVNFGAFMHAWITVSNAARTGAQYLCLGGATINAPASPSIPAVQALVANDLASLPRSTTANVCVSTSNSTVVTCTNGAPPAGAPPATDTPEGAPAVTFIIGAVDVTYTYEPLIPLWDFSNLGIHATLPPTTIHRQAQMRILQ